MNALRLILVLLLLAAPAAAQMPEGADDPAYQEAVEHWLAGDDHAALPELGRLAHGENLAAQVLLARIDSKSAYTWKWRRAIGREEYDRVFGVPGHRPAGFLASWRQVASLRSPLALTFREAGLILGSVPLAVDAVGRLVEAGEERAVWQTLHGLFSQGFGTYSFGSPPMDTCLTTCATMLGRRR